MKHLTVDEILDFVSLTDLSRESVELAAKVNGHTRRCEQCRKTVCAFQEIYDQFVRYSAEGSFKNFISEHFSGMMPSASGEPDAPEMSR